MKRPMVGAALLLILLSGMSNAATELFSVDFDTDSLVRIDVTTGHATVVGALGVSLNDFDLTNHGGRLYGVDSVGFTRATL